MIKSTEIQSLMTAASIDKIYRPHGLLEDCKGLQGPFIDPGMNNIANILSLSQSYTYKPSFKLVSCYLYASFNYIPSEILLYRLIIDLQEPKLCDLMNDSS